jgi:uncharacterized protein (TIGR03086 family)
MDELLILHGLALDEFGRRVRAVGDNQWQAPTPCTRWNVRALVNHLTAEQLWVVPLLRGATVLDVGDRLDGDHLGTDPPASWQRAASQARAAFLAAQPLDDHPVRMTPHRQVSAAHYCREMTCDLTIHAWDLARACGTSERLDPRLVAAVYDWTLPHAGALATSGLVDPPVPVSDTATPQSRLLALFGRRS